MKSHSAGSFGPWNSAEPGDTALNGDYTFDHADLGVFIGIAGILHSTGRFEGELDTITARGEADVPDFRLKRSGNPVPLHTKFEVLVDGTNGNTTLKPVTATLGSTHFTTSGAVFKHEGDTHRTIKLDVNMPQGKHARRFTSGDEGRTLSWKARSISKPRLRFRRWMAKSGTNCASMATSMSPKATSSGPPSRTRSIALAGARRGSRKTRRSTR